MVWAVELIGAVAQRVDSLPLDLDIQLLILRGVVGEDLRHGPVADTRDQPGAGERVVRDRSGRSDGLNAGEYGCGQAQGDLRGLPGRRKRRRLKIGERRGVLSLSGGNARLSDGEY